MSKTGEQRSDVSLYFVSKVNMKSRATLEPRIPQNFLTDNGFEDNKIKRVCFSTSIDGAVTALSQNLKNTDLFVYSPVGVNKKDVYTPSVSQVPDRAITGEVWIKKPIQIEFIGKIHVIDAKKNPQRYKYGNNTAELYEWNWKWVDKNVNESVSAVYGAYDLHNKWNAAVDIDGKTYRNRVECLIVNGGKLFVSLDKNGNIIIPGGSTEKDIDDDTQIANECREEARINIKNPIYTGINRVQDTPPRISKHKSALPFVYDGSVSKVYVAEYDSHYDGYIDEYDKDEKMIRGNFIPLKDVINRLKPEWISALNNYTDKSHNYDTRNNRDYQVDCEKKRGFGPDEDWGDANLNESFVDNDLVMENLTDIPNGVNPYSRTKFFHLSLDDKLDGKTLTPRIPSWIKKMMADNKEEFIKNMETVKKGGSTDKIYYYEEYKTPRVCFSSSINGCLNAILMDSGDRLNLVGKCVHVYAPEKPIDQYKHRTNKEIKKSGDIFDANITNEIWILEPVKVKYYGSIIVDSAKECRFLRKTTSDKNKTIAKFNYKWHWYLKERKRKENNKNVNESVVMNKDDYYFDFDKFKSGESNILFVTGLTGSGKSTIGRSLASKYHAEYVELDLMDPCSNLCSQSLDKIKKDKSNKVIYEYLSSHKSVYERLKSGKMRDDEIFLNNARFISFARSYANKHKDTKFIVEGLQLYEYCTFRKTIIKPMIIKGTSVLTSFIRKVKREKWSTKDIIKYAPGTVKRMIKDDKMLLQLINACKTDDAINESVSSVTSKSAKGPDDSLAKDIRAVIKSLSSGDYKSFDYKSKKMYYQSVYYDGDNPIGFVFTRSFDEEGRHSLTISVALNPDYRGKGLALRMVREVLNTIKQDKSIYQIYWGADMDNKGSIELAKRAGFKHNYDYRDSTFYTKVVNNTKNVNESTLIPCDDKKEGSMSVGNGKELTYDSDDWNRKVKVFSKGGSDIHCKKGDKVYRITNSPKESIGGKRKYVTLKKSDAIRYSNPKYGIITNPMSGKIITFSLTKDIKVAGVTTALKAISEVYGLDKFDFSDYKKFSFAAGSGRVLQKISDMGYDAVIDPEDISSGISKSSIIILSPKDVLSIDSCDDLSKNINESVKRSELPDDVFGIPQERKYPMQDKQHVKAAIKFFNYVEPKYEEQLANRIIENMKMYNIDPSSVGDKNRLKKYIKESTMEGSYSNMRESLADELAFMYFESENDPNVPDLIEPVVKQLESKGYQVKYASPGHINTRFNNDRNKDGVINAKMTSTARIIFSRDYHFKSTPQGWEWKVLNNNSKALYVKPYTYNEKMGRKEEAFKKWQTFYISNIKTWAAELPKVGTDKDSAPDTNF